jgi:hypothetical protein
MIRVAVAAALALALAHAARAGDRTLYIDHADGSRTVVIERGGNQFGVTTKGGVIVDRFTVYDPDYRRAGPPPR